MHQVEYIVDGRLPDDLSQGLVFSVEELARLKRRIGVRPAYGARILCMDQIYRKRRGIRDQI